MMSSHSDVDLHTAVKQQDGHPVDIAIIGLSARVPGAGNVDELWSLLMSGKDGLTTFEPFEVAAELERLNESERARYVARRGVLQGIEDFDAAFFNLSAAEASLLDPQHRLLMEVVWEALEDAGAADCAGQNVGVFSTSGLSNYLIKNLLPDPSISERHGQLQLLMLNDKDFLAARIAYFLNVHGPAVNVQTGCSSSLAALHYACLSLLQGDCEMAIVGGVSIALPQQSGYVFAENMIGSRDGFCRAFDGEASGTVRGNGACAVVLKPLAKALADKDPVWAVVKGSALNNDGRDKVGFTAPSAKWQAEVIASTYRRSGVALEDIDFVEAHGTGTPLGDPIEARAINQVFSLSGARRPRYLGALKTQIGHLDTAAGIAGLIKLCLALRHGVIPPTAHFQVLNPRISFEDSQFTINTVPVAWPQKEKPRCAALSSFGIGGTNAHVVVAEGPVLEASLAGSGPYVVIVSAKSADSLTALQHAYADAIEALTDTELADFAYSTRVGRKFFEHRLAICVENRNDAINELRAARSQSARKPVGGVNVEIADAQAVGTLLGIELPDKPNGWIDGLKARLAELGVAFDVASPVRLTVADERLHVSVASTSPAAVHARPPVAIGPHLQVSLWQAGVKVDFNYPAGSPPGRRIRIPAYRFDRQRYWIEPPPERRDDAQVDGASGFATKQQKPPAARPTSLIALETMLLSQWQELLGTHALRSTDNVFEHGADSLTVAQFVSQLTSEGTLPVHVVDCYSAPSVDGQSRLIGERLGLDGDPAVAPVETVPVIEVERFDNL